MVARRVVIAAGICSILLAPTVQAEVTSHTIHDEIGDQKGPFRYHDLQAIQLGSNGTGLTVTFELHLDELLLQYNPSEYSFSFRLRSDDEGLSQSLRCRYWWGQSEPESPSCVFQYARHVKQDLIIAYQAEYVTTPVPAIMDPDAGRLSVSVPYSAFEAVSGDQLYRFAASTRVCDPYAWFLMEHSPCVPLIDEVADWATDLRLA